MRDTVEPDMVDDCERHEAKFSGLIQGRGGPQFRPYPVSSTSTPRPA